VVQDGAASKTGLKSMRDTELLCLKALKDELVDTSPNKHRYSDRKVVNIAAESVAAEEGRELEGTEKDVQAESNFVRDLGTWPPSKKMSRHILHLVPKGRKMNVLCR